MSKAKIKLHEFDHNGHHYEVVYDEYHETVGSYAYDTEEETKAAEDEEIRKLESGEWVVVGVVESRECKGLSAVAGTTGHCEGCGGGDGGRARVETDSVWGFVVEDAAEVERMVRAGEVF